MGIVRFSINVQVYSVPHEGKSTLVTYIVVLVRSVWPRALPIALGVCCTEDLDPFCLLYALVGLTVGLRKTFLMELEGAQLRQRLCRVVTKRTPANKHSAQER